jgi:hypothetical protein
MTSRLFSLVAVPLSLVGHLMFWGGSATLLRSMFQFSGQFDVVAFAVTLVGLLVILAAIATVAIGSLGAYVVGIVQLVFSLLLHLVPFDFRNGGFSPAFEIMNAVRGASMEISDGMFFYFPTGVGVVTGVVFLAAAVASDRRRVPMPGTAARVGSALAGVVALVGLLLAIAFGALVYVRQLVMLAGANPLDIVLLYAGAVLFALAVAAAAWSSVGAVVAGGLTSIAGLIGLAVPRELVNAAGGWGELRRGLEILAPSGELLLIGLLAVVAGLAVRIRARRRTGAPAFASPSTEPAPPVGPPSV